MVSRVFRITDSTQKNDEQDTPVGQIIMTQTRILHIGANENGGGVLQYVKNIASSTSDGYSHFIPTKVEHNYDHLISVATKGRELHSPKDVFQLAKLVKELKIDLVHAHTARAGLIALLSKLLFQICYVYTGHGWRFAQLRGIKSIWMRTCEKLIVQFSLRSVSISNYEYEQAIELGLQHKCKKINTRIRFASISHRTSVSNTIIACGEVYYLKRPKDFLEIAIALNDRRQNFVWVGDGPDLEQMKRTTADYPNVSFVGKLKHRDYLELLKTASAFVITSEIEGVPFVALEAFSNSIPVVSSKYPGWEEIDVLNNDQMFYEIGDAAKCASIISELLETPSIAKMQHKQAKDKFSPLSRFGKEYESIYIC